MRVLSVVDAAEKLCRGEVVIYPTETFYGVGCVACSGQSVARVYAAKNRRAQLPLPVLGADKEQLARVARFSPQALALARQFWPGPLTLLLPALPCVPDTITAGTGRIAVRVTSHPIARELAALTGQALAASSANISGTPPVADAHLLDATLLTRVDGVVMEGPQPAGGLPSTLAEEVAMPKPTLRILRVGAVSCEALEAAGYALMLPG